MKNSLDNDNSINISFLILQIIFIAFLVVAIVVLQYPNQLSEVIEKELAGHMIIEHGIFFLLGYLVMNVMDKIRGERIVLLSGLQPEKRIKDKATRETEVKRNRKTKYEIKKYENTKFVWIIAIIFLMIFWHIPFIFNFALYHNPIHLIQHISFIFVGICIYEIIKKFDFTIVLFFFILSGGIMGISGLLFALTTDNNPVYSYYTIQSHIDAGNSMVISAILMTFIVFPILLIKKSINLLKDSADNNDSRRHF